ncbi:type II toxin-antitoxin system HicB family antitoxin [bacterium]|nr:type II toxin-antitoxin system HicB family antitoxin [bacterium]
MNNYEVKVIPQKDADGNLYWTASFPAVKGCVGGGDTAEAAVEEAMENLSVLLEFLEESGETIPDEYQENSCSGKIALRISKSTHKHLSEIAAKEGISINSFLCGAIEHYLGMKEYDYRLDKKIESLQRIAEKTLEWQIGTFFLNQQILSGQSEKEIEKAYSLPVGGEFE